MCGEKMRAINLKTEYLVNPIGIDLENPRLMWNCEGGVKQTAYRIVAKADGKEIWDSGKISSSSMRAEYPVPLVSRQRVEWKVLLWDENGEEGEWSDAFFETGLLCSSEWKAKWIAGNYRVDPKKRYPVDCFYKAFKANGIAKARLYVTACGLYEVRINGKKAGDAVFTPGSTDYRKRIQYQTYDVTSLIRDGANVISAELADGWYRGSNGGKGKTNTYGKQTKLLAQLELSDATGDGVPLYTARVGRACQTRHRVCLSAVGKRRDAGLAVYAQERSDDHLGELGRAYDQR